MSLDQISEDMQKVWQDRLQTDMELQQSIRERQELPVFGHKQQILDAVNDNPVVIIRGNTGCGKTTQVCSIFKLSFSLGQYKSTRWPIPLVTKISQSLMESLFLFHLLNYLNCIQFI